MFSISVRKPRCLQSANSSTYSCVSEQRVSIHRVRPISTHSSATVFLKLGSFCKSVLPRNGFVFSNRPKWTPRLRLLNAATRAVSCLLSSVSQRAARQRLYPGPTCSSVPVFLKLGSFCKSVLPRNGFVFSNRPMNSAPPIAQSANRAAPVFCLLSPVFWMAPISKLTRRLRKIVNGKCPTHSIPKISPPH
jgi:hypothetical protein